MKILSFDSSRKRLSFTVFDTETEELLCTGASEKKSSQLISEMYEIFRKNNLEINDIDILLTSIGPGSFTGIRASLSIAKTLAAQLKTKIFAIDNFSLARFEKKDDGKIALMAGKNDYFISLDNDIKNIETNYYADQLEDDIVYNFQTDNISKLVLDFYLATKDKESYLYDYNTLEAYYLREPSINVSNKTHV